MNTNVASLYYNNKIKDYLADNAKEISNNSATYCSLQTSILHLPTHNRISIKETYYFIEELEKYNTYNFKNNFFLDTLFAQLPNIKLENLEEQEYFLKLFQKDKKSGVYHFTEKDIQNELTIDFLTNNFDLDFIAHNNPIEVFIKNRCSNIKNLQKILDNFPNLFHKEVYSAQNTFTSIICNGEDRIVELLDQRHFKDLKNISFIKNILNERELNTFQLFIDKGLNPFLIHDTKEVFQAFISNTKNEDLINGIYNKNNTTIVQDIIDNPHNIPYETHLNNPIVLSKFKEAIVIKPEIIENLDINKLLSHNIFLKSLKEIMMINPKFINKKIDNKNLLEISVSHKNYETAKMLTDMNPPLILNKSRNKFVVETMITNYIKDKKAHNKDINLNLIKEHIEYIISKQESTPTLSKKIEDLSKHVKDPVLNSFLKYTQMHISLNKSDEIKPKMKI